MDLSCSLALAGCALANRNICIFHKIFFSLSHILQIFDLKPATTYVFLTRAENSYGLSEPSAMSSAIKSLANDNNGAVLPSELAAARTALSGKVN